eukprot:Pgem_evm1s6069
MDRKGQSVHGPVSKLAANYYPQLQSKFVFLNPPKWMRVVYSCMKAILPKRNMEKV